MSEAQTERVAEGTRKAEPEPPATAAGSRTILVDGFNVLHAVLLGEDRAGAWWRSELRARLLDRVSAWREGDDEIWVAFDGARPATSVWAEPVATPNGDPGTQAGPTVHVVFVESADDWIVRRARRAEEPSRLMVVSADRKVTGRSRSAGCEIMTPWAFIARCPTGAAAQPERASPEKSKASMILDAFSSTARPLTSTIRQP
jgi:hypothetical protein